MLVLALAAVSAVHANDEAKRKAIRMKTSRQLKEIMKELDIAHPSSISKDDIRELAYTEDAVNRWEELHPEKKRRPKGAGGGGDPFGSFGGGEAPDGMDPAEWERLMAQMKGDFSFEKDPEKRRILEKLKARGMSMGGGNNMDIEQLRNLEKMMDGINMENFKDPPPTSGPRGGDDEEIDMEKEEL